MLSMFLLVLSSLLPHPCAQTTSTFSDEAFRREEVLQHLRKEFHVELMEPKGPALGTPLLIYLESYFTKAPRLEAPIRLHATGERGPRKVWRREGNGSGIDLYFSKNAAEGLAGLRELESGEGSAGVETRQDLFLQLTEALYPIASLKRMLLERYRISTDCRGSADPCDSFKKHELAILLGILEDLPSYIVENLKLSRFHRFPDNVSTLDSIHAVAAYRNGVILVTSRAFEIPEDRSGEGTLVHELGHAVWPSLSFDLRMSFESLSWTREAESGALRLKSSNSGWISDYAAESPEEDFAEHFSAFMVQPERLSRLAPAKRRWLQEKVFIDTEYFTTSDANARIFVPSKTPDTAAPRFLGDLPSSIEITNEIVDAKKTRLRIRLQGLVDDLSGLESCKLYFRSQESLSGNPIQMIFEFDSSNAREIAPDVYEIEDALDRHDLPAGRVHLRLITLRDRAGNVEHLPTETLGIFFELLGTASPERLSKNSMLFENDRQKKLRNEIMKSLDPHRPEVRFQPGAEPGRFRLQLPKEIDEQRDRLESAELIFYGVEEIEIGDWKHSSRKYEQKVSYRIDRKALDSGKSASGFDLDIDLRRGVSVDKLMLSSVTLQYRSLDWSIELLDYSNPTVFEPKSIGSDPTPAEIDLNGMGLELKPHPAEKDALILKTRFSMKGFEHGGKVRMSFQTPSGRRIFGETLELKPGEGGAEIEIPLDRYREQGEYLIHEFEIMENHPKGSSPAVSEGKQYRIQKVSTRGIRKSIQVRKPAA